MGKSVRFADDQNKMVKYNVLDENDFDLDRDDDLESIRSVELGLKDEQDSSPTFPDEWNLDRVAWEQRLRRVRRIAWIEAGLLALLVGYVVVLHFQRYMPPAGDVPLGVDPSGFVPPDIGQPVKWMKYDDETDPHYFKPDAFENLDNVRAAAKDFKMLHNASNVHINGKYTTYMDFNNERQPLPAYVTRKGSELYSIRAFHQMHCISIIFEDIGYRVNNKTSKWETGHVIHCLNTVRSAITCLADATPISYINGMGVGHTTDDQQSHCRDFFALREWAHDPVRRARWVNVAPEDEKDVYEEIL
ncbi:Putative mycotoxin biosynthesis protein UstYa [Colletotrichum destructivum]|uniref:Mycotoxin biosynthesis protein UstYa n=1 Tax=Colletotrichum destructivum TaxID=34406 RepID=A0AAX4J3I4_9PEZI|nr:Putative mycotoxin biosynthesis protein UstYa [Colletotrichum destructivum]